MSKRLAVGDVVRARILELSHDGSNSNVRLLAPSSINDASIREFVVLEAVQYASVHNSSRSTDTRLVIGTPLPRRNRSNLRNPAIRYTVTCEDAVDADVPILAQKYEVEREVSYYITPVKVERFFIEENATAQEYALFERAEMSELGHRLLAIFPSAELAQLGQRVAEKVAAP